MIYKLEIADSGSAPIDVMCAHVIPRVGDYIVYDKLDYKVIEVSHIVAKGGATQGASSGSPIVRVELETHEDADDK